MVSTDTGIRALHDLGIAAWFGGSLVVAIGMERARSETDDAYEHGRAVDAWLRTWAPVNAAAATSYFTAGTLLTLANKGRLLAERGVFTSAAIVGGAGVAAAALGLYARSLRRRLATSIRAAAASPTQEADSDQRADVGRVLRRVRAAHWPVPVLTGTMLVFNARLGELQRPKVVLSGIARRVLSDRLTA
jgi:hypothetical protein